MLRIAAAIMAMGLAMPIDAQVVIDRTRSTSTPTMTREPSATMATLLRPLPAPANLVVNGTPASASLRWDAVTGATSYSVLRADASGTKTLLTATPITTTSFADLSGGVKPGSTYTYLVSAMASNWNPGTAQASFTVPKPDVPAWARLQTQADGGTMLTWATVPGASQYQVLETYIVPVYKTVYVNGTNQTVQSGWEQRMRSYVTVGPPLSLATQAGATYRIGASYMPGSVTAPSSEWPVAVKQ